MVRWRLPKLGLLHKKITSQFEIPISHFSSFFFKHEDVKVILSMTIEIKCSLKSGLYFFIRKNICAKFYFDFRTNVTPFFFVPLQKFFEKDG